MPFAREAVKPTGFGVFPCSGSFGGGFWFSVLSGGKAWRAILVDLVVFCAAEV
jgi:hypothetical protein